MQGSRPTADSLLAERLARGWRPTPTDTRDGPVVMGFACKVAAPIDPANR